jgi:hypothetical protein
MINDDNPAPGSPNRRRKPARPSTHSPPADRPYRVGKGKPPVEHQFKEGQPSPNPRGRPKGSTRVNTLEKLLRKMVVVGHKNGKPVRKTLGEVIDHKLVEQAASGDLNAIKLIREIEFRYQKAGFAALPSADELIRQREEEQAKQALVEKIRQGIIDHLQVVASMKKLGVIESVNGRECIAKWILDELAARRAAKNAARQGFKPSP